MKDGKRKGKEFCLTRTAKLWNLNKRHSAFLEDRGSPFANAEIHDQSYIYQRRWGLIHLSRRISFLGCHNQYHILDGLNNRRVMSYSTRGWKHSSSSFLLKAVSSLSYLIRSMHHCWLLVLCWKSLVFLGLWQQNSDFHTAVSLCACLCVQIPPFHKDTVILG